MSYSRDKELRVIYLEKIKAHFQKAHLPDGWRIYTYDSSVKFLSKKMVLSFIPPLRVDVEEGVTHSRHFKSATDAIEYLEIMMGEHSCQL